MFAVGNVRLFRMSDNAFLVLNFSRANINTDAIVSDAVFYKLDKSRKKSIFFDLSDYSEFCLVYFDCTLAKRTGND